MSTLEGSLGSRSPRVVCLGLALPLGPSSLGSVFDLTKGVQWHLVILEGVAMV